MPARAASSNLKVTPLMSESLPASLICKTGNPSIAHRLHLRHGPGVVAAANAKLSSNRASLAQESQHQRDSGEHDREDEPEQRQPVCVAHDVSASQRL